MTLVDKKAMVIAYPLLAQEEDRRERLLQQYHNLGLLEEI
jgi:hypothetical protein